MSKRSDIKIVGANELPAEQKPGAPPHPFSQMNRNATRGEAVAAATNVGKSVYDQISEEHNAAMTSLYNEFAQFREVAARRIRQLEKLSWSFIINRALRADYGRAVKWILLQVATVRGWLSVLRNTGSVSRLASEAARIHEDAGVLPELVNQVELLAMIRSGKAVALRWTGNVEDLKDGPFAEFYHEGMVTRTDGAIPIRDQEGKEELCRVGDLLLLKDGELSVQQGSVAIGVDVTAKVDAQEATA